MNSDPHWQTLIKQALEEDLGQLGDLTSRYFIPEDAVTSVRMVARQTCTLSGVEIAADVFRKVDSSLDIIEGVASGHAISADEINRCPILAISGPARSILTAERTALNFAQRLSGVATLTAAFVDAIAGTNCTILDTRKTTPGWRHLEKDAVRHGGGQNHRMGLYDRVMIKDNHLAAQGGLEGIQAAIDELHRDHPHIEVELEADTLAQVQSFLSLRGVQHLLLDNMSTDDLRTAVALASGTPVRLEASGGIDLTTVRDIALTGVDFISVGALTHSSPSIDLALDAPSS